MKNILTLAALAAYAVVPAAALAVSVDYGGSGKVNVNDIQVQYAPGSVNVQTGTGTVTNVQFNGSANAGGNVILRNNEGGIVNVSTGSGLNVIVSGGLDANSRGAIVSLDGNSASLITTDADLQAYNKLVVEERKSITAVDSSDGHVVVSYRQPAKLLGFVPLSLTATVDVDVDGKVTVRTPWYGFLFTKSTSSVRTIVQSDLDAEVSTKRIRVGADTNASASVRNSAYIVNVVTSSIDGTTSVSVE